MQKLNILNPTSKRQNRWDSMTTAALPTPSIPNRSVTGYLRVQTRALWRHITNISITVCTMQMLFVLRGTQEFWKENCTLQLFSVGSQTVLNKNVFSSSCSQTEAIVIILFKDTDLRWVLSTRDSPWGFTQGVARHHSGIPLERTGCD